MPGKDFQFDLRGLCHLHAISPEEFSQMTGIPPGKLLDLLKGRKADKSTGRRIAGLLHLFEELAEEIAPPLGPWLRAPNGAFRGRSPMQLLAQGKEFRLRQMVYLVGSGQPL